MMNSVVSNPAFTTWRVMLLILFISASSTLNAQMPNPLSFFPHHEGDVFEYQSFSHNYYFQNIITHDSLAPDGVYYIETTYFGGMSLDTITYELRNTQWGIPFYSTLLCKLDADSGDSWIAWRNEAGAIKAEVSMVFLTYLFSQWLWGKKIDYTDSASGLYLRSFYFAEKFGIVREDQDPDPIYYLRGAIVNGIKYGTVTSVPPKIISSLPQFVHLSQNFPNPFNPNTKIEYDLPRESKVDLRVYNTLGQEVSVLANGLKSKGHHQVIFDAELLPSGVYIYRLRTSFGVICRKMLLTK